MRLQLTDDGYSYRIYGHRTTIIIYGDSVHQRWVQVDLVQQPAPIEYPQRVYDQPFVEEAGRKYFWQAFHHE